MSARKLAAITALVLVLLAACGGYHGPAVGEVEKRTFAPAHVEVGYSMICAAYGQYGCTVWVTIPYSNDIPDAWYLTITSCEKPDDPKSCKRGSFEVTHEMFDSVEIGMSVEYAAVKKP